MHVEFLWGVTQHSTQPKNENAFKNGLKMILAKFQLVELPPTPSIPACPHTHIHTYRLMVIAISARPIEDRAPLQEFGQSRGARLRIKPEMHASVKVIATPPPPSTPHPQSNFHPTCLKDTEKTRTLQGNGLHNAPAANVSDASRKTPAVVRAHDAITMETDDADVKSSHALFPVLRPSLHGKPGDLSRISSRLRLGAELCPILYLGQSDTDKLCSCLTE